MNKQELLAISHAIEQLAKTEAIRARTFIVSEEVKTGMISIEEAKNLLEKLYNQTQLIGL